MNQKCELTVFFDASCSLCNSEMQAIKVRDTLNLISLADCSALDFDDSSYRRSGITREAMMQSLHVLDKYGNWTKGVLAFELIYQTIGMPRIANLWGGRFTRPLAELAYRWIARHRQFIAWSGVPILFKLWGKFESHRAYVRSRKCSEGKCSI